MGRTHGSEVAAKAECDNAGQLGIMHSGSEVAAMLHNLGES